MTDLTLVDKDGRVFDVAVIEHQIVEPAMYANEGGFLCEKGEETWFVSDDGRADRLNKDGTWEMGLAACNELRARQEKYEELYERWQEERYEQS